MAFIKIDGVDLYPYTRIAPGEGLDVADTDFTEPQFGDSAAGVGFPLLSVKTNNREISVPVHLNPRLRNLWHLGNFDYEIDAQLAFRGNLDNPGPGTFTDQGTISTAWAPTGYAKSGHYKYTNIGSATPNDYFIDAPGSSSVAVTPGSSYTFTVGINVIDGATTIGASGGWYVQIFWYRSNGSASFVTPSTTGVIGLGTGTGEATLTVTGVAPSDAAGAGMRIMLLDLTTASDVIELYIGTWSFRCTTVSKDALHALISDLNRRLAVAKIFEWRDDGASGTSFFDVEFARFEPEFNKRRQDAGWMSGVIRLFTRPYAHKVASGYAAFLGTGVSNTIIGSIPLPPGSSNGDAPVSLRWQVTTPSLVGRSDGRIIGAAIVPSGYIAEWSAASILRFNGATLAGASGAAGSQVLAHSYYDILGFINGQPLVPNLPFAQVILPNASVYAGRNRVFAVAQSRLPAHPIAMVGDRGGWAQYPVSPTTIPGQGYSLIDLGVLQVDPLANATPVITLSPFSQIDLKRITFASGRSFATAGWPDININRIVVLPENNSQLIVDDSRRRVLGGFDAYNFAGASTPFRIDNFGNIATSLTGANVACYGFVQKSDRLTVDSVGQNGPAADLIGTPTVANLSAMLDGVLTRSNTLANNNQFVIGKYAGQYFSARITTFGTPTTTYASCALSIITGNVGVGLGTPSVLASIPFNIGTSAANTIPFRLRFSQQGPLLRAEAYAQTASPYLLTTATCSASIAYAAQPGVGYIGMGTDDGTNGGLAYFDFSEVPSAGIAGGDTYTMDTDKRTAIRGITSKFTLGEELRGGYLSAPPNATSAGVFIAMVAPIDGGTTDQTWSFSVSYNEHFTYAV